MTSGPCAGRSRLCGSGGPVPWSWSGGAPRPGGGRDAPAAGQGRGTLPDRWTWLCPDRLGPDRPGLSRRVPRVWTLTRRRRIRSRAGKFAVAAEQRPGTGGPSSATRRVRGCPASSKAAPSAFICSRFTHRSSGRPRNIAVVGPGVKFVESPWNGRNHPGLGRCGGQGPPGRLGPWPWPQPGLGTGRGPGGGDRGVAGLGAGVGPDRDRGILGRGRSPRCGGDRVAYRAAARRRRHRNADRPARTSCGSRASATSLASGLKYPRSDQDRIVRSDRSSDQIDQIRVSFHFLNRSINQSEQPLDLDQSRKSDHRTDQIARSQWIVSSDRSIGSSSDNQTNRDRQLNLQQRRQFGRQPPDGPRQPRARVTNAAVAAGAAPSSPPRRRKLEDVAVTEDRDVGDVILEPGGPSPGQRCRVPPAGRRSRAYAAQRFGHLRAAACGRRPEIGAVLVSSTPGCGNLTVTGMSGCPR